MLKTVVEGSYAPNKRETATYAHNVGKKANDAVLGPDVLKPRPAGPRVLVTGRAASCFDTTGQQPIQGSAWKTSNSGRPKFQHRSFTGWVSGEDSIKPLEAKIVMLPEKTISFTWRFEGSLLRMRHTQLSLGAFREDL
ncbi:hypothetical protein F5887DRAFT_917495 [Amanita rubescens]|nr:hypothetical protein F5887DRAFT_917495 [Amanita rubescens]